jgi:hypothetical protein
MRRWKLVSTMTFAGVLTSIAASAMPREANKEQRPRESVPSDESVTNPPQLHTLVLEKPQPRRHTSSYADLEPPDDDQSSKVKSDWYGGQTLAIDVPVFVLLTALAASDKPTPVYLGLGAYTVGAPIVHFANGEVGRGIGSLALRVVTAPLGLLAYNSFSGARRNCDDTNSREPSECGFDVLGAGVAGILALSVMGGVIAIDAAAIARHDPSRNPRTTAAIEYVPNLVLGHDSAMVTWGGAF